MTSAVKVALNPNTTNNVNKSWSKSIRQPLQSFSNSPKKITNMQEKNLLSHKNPYFWCDIATTNFLVLHMCEIRFHDVINRTVHMLTLWCHPMQKSQNMTKWICFGPLISNLICWIQLCDKKNWTFIDSWDQDLCENRPWCIDTKSRLCWQQSFKTLWETKCWNTKNKGFTNSKTLFHS